jgi:hypothetical protein
VKTFKEFLESVNPGSFLNTGWSGVDSNQFFNVGHSNDVDLPTPTLDMPTRTISSKIRKIAYTENPISILLDNGSMWKLTKKQWDHLKSYGREPKENARVEMEMTVDGTIKSINII